ncbi:MAG: error-prone DNA polymerase, partial [Bryobacteraceae bacterium]|nr:error-prone DNA polymerase [Bryobacteraceae bacterium]
HGAAMTANVITFRGRSAMREVGKALNFSNDVIERFSSLYANGDFPHTLDFTAQIEKAGIPKNHPRAGVAAFLFGAIRSLPRHLGQHSGGMIICQGQLDSIVPLENASMPGRVVAQWDKDDCDDLGIIKVDLLGLGMMSVLQDSVELTSRNGPKVDLARIPLDDPAVYEMMCKAETIGVFQIESRAQMATLPRMKPKEFYDVVVEVAIIRPGPIQGHLMHPYLKRRQGREPVTYYDEALKPVLARTLGVPLFQEQMLKMAMVMADFTGDEAEELRRALSFHRSQERMNGVEIKLREAMARKGYGQEVVDRVIAAISSFALYGFPESHAISFAHLAYCSAWLKVHRAPEFYASLLNNQPMGFYSTATLIQDGRRRGVKFRPVSLNQSGWQCSVEADKAVQLGLCVVQGLNNLHAESALQQRNHRPFESISDLRRRSVFTKPELRVLAEVGALDHLTRHRRDALWQVEAYFAPDDLFTDGIDSALEFPPLEEMNFTDRLQADYSGMQFSLGPHPMAFLRSELHGVMAAAELSSVKYGQNVRIAGSVICRQRPGTAKGFVFLSLEDETGIANAIVTPALFERLRLLITEEPFLLVEGILQNADGVTHVRAHCIEPLSHGEMATVGSHDFH